MKKVELIIVLQCGKSDKMLITLKNDMFGCFRIEENEAMTTEQV